MTTKRNIKRRLDDLEDEHGADESAEMDAGELLMEHLRAIHDQRLGDADRAWTAYQERVAPAAEMEGE